MATVLKKFVSKTPRCEIVSATRDVVDGLLAGNADNRVVRRGWVDYLVQQARAGTFILTGQGVSVDRNGALMDGQHRLIALQEAGYPTARLLVVYGLPPEARAALDIGIKRTFSDMMRFAFNRPEATGTMIATARFWGIQREPGRDLWVRPSPQEVAAWYVEAAPFLERVLSVTNAHRLTAPVLAAVCAHGLAHPDDADRCVEFVGALATGAHLGVNSPVLLLRNWLASHRRGGGLGLSREKYEKTLRAVELFVSGASVQKLRRAKKRVPQREESHG